LLSELDVFVPASKLLINNKPP